MHVMRSGSRSCACSRTSAIASPRFPGSQTPRSPAPRRLEPDALDNILHIEGQTYAEGQIPPDRRFMFVAPEFFKTVGISMVAGRDISLDRVYERRQVAIVSENLAREIWREPARRWGSAFAQQPEPWREIVGVVGNVHDNGVDERAPATVYWPIMMANFWLQRSVRVQRGRRLRGSQPARRRVKSSSTSSRQPSGR